MFSSERTSRTVNAGICQGKWSRETLVVPAKLNLHTKMHGNAQSISWIEGQPSIASPWGENALVVVYSLKNHCCSAPECLLCCAHTATSTIYTETAVCHKEYNPAPNKPTTDTHKPSELTLLAVISGQLKTTHLFH